MCFSFFVCFLSSLVWFFLWLPEEVLALLFLLHSENGDFYILVKDTFEVPFCGDFSAISFAFLALDREKSLSLVVEVLPGMFCT